jgi:hypothetical protein
MSKNGKRTDTSAFISGIKSTSRAAAPYINQRMRTQIQNIGRSNVKIGKQVQDALIDIADFTVKQALHTQLLKNKVKTDVKTVSKEGIGLDHSGMVKMVSEFYSKPITSYVSQEHINIKRHKYKVFMNKKPKGKFSTVPHGFKTVKRVLWDSQIDCPKIEDKLDLTTKSGFSESIVDFLGPQSYLTVEDAFQLTDCQRELEMEELRLAKKHRQNVAIMASETGSVRERLASAQIAELGKSRLFSKIQKINTQLNIHSDSISYLTYLSVHMVCHKRFTQTNCNRATLTTDELYEQILLDCDNNLNRSVRKKQIIKALKQKKKPNIFKRTMIVEPGTRIMQSQTVRDNLNILKTFRFILKPTEVASIDVTLNTTYGIDLKDLAKTESSTAAANIFFICEASGDANARVSSKTFEEIKLSGLSPINLRYETKRTVSWIANEKNVDKPATIVVEEPETLFESIELSELFYPNRSNSKNIPLKKLEVKTPNSKAEFILDLDQGTSLGPTIVDRMQSVSQSNWLDLPDALHLKEMLDQKNINMQNSLGNGEQPIEFDESNTTTAEEIFSEHIDSKSDLDPDWIDLDNLDN